MPRTLQTSVRAIAVDREDLVKVVLDGLRMCDPAETHGPNVVAVLLWDARLVLANFWHHTNLPGGKSNADVEDERGSWTLSREKVEALVDRLLNDGVRFTTLVGLGEEYCGLQWTIHAPPPAPPKS